MFESFKNKLNGEKSSKEEYEEKEKELVEAKQEVDNKPIKTSMEFKKGGDLDFSLEYIPDDAEERYMQALEELKRLKEENQDEAIELDDRYNKLLADRNDLLEKISNIEDDSEKQELISRLGNKNKEIRLFEEKELNV